jgi:hypothetical protein
VIGIHCHAVRPGDVLLAGRRGGIRLEVLGTWHDAEARLVYLALLWRGERIVQWALGEAEMAWKVAGDAGG